MSEDYEVTTIELNEEEVAIVIGKEQFGIYLPEDGDQDVPDVAVMVLAVLSMYDKDPKNPVLDQLLDWVQNTSGTKEVH